MGCNQNQVIALRNMTYQYPSRRLFVTATLMLLLAATLPGVAAAPSSGPSSVDIYTFLHVSMLPGYEEHWLSCEDVTSTVGLWEIA